MTIKLLNNGRCPKCYRKIRIDDNREYIVYKSRFIRVHKSKNTIESKCPGCGKIIVV